MARQIMPGDQFGMLTVLGRDMFDYIRPYDQAHIPMYVCRCSCPNQTIVSVRKDQLLDKRRGTRSCGCLAMVSGYKHGLNNTKLQSVLDGIMPGLLPLAATAIYYKLLQKKTNVILMLKLFKLLAMI